MRSNEVVKNQAGIDWLFAKYGKPAAKSVEMTDAAKMVIAALVDSGATLSKTDGNKAYLQRPGGNRQSGNVLLDTGQFYCHTSNWRHLKPVRDTAQRVYRPCWVKNNHKAKSSPVKPFCCLI